MSKARTATQARIAKAPIMSQEAKLSMWHISSRLALATLLMTATNCGAEGVGDESSALGTVTAALSDDDPDVDSNHPNAVVVEESKHALNYTPGQPGYYGGPAAVPASMKMYAVGDRNATIQTTDNNRCTYVGSGGWKKVSDSSDYAAVCTAQARAEAARLAAAHPDAPPSCYVGTGTIESMKCGDTQRVCTPTYGGGSDCRTVSALTTVCHIKVTRSANMHYYPITVAGLEYEFPGGSDTFEEFTDTATQGVSWSTKKSGGATVKTGIVTKLLTSDASGSYSFSVTKSGTMSMTTSLGKRHEGSEPFRHHQGDRFSLWINPSINYWFQCSDGDHAIYGIARAEKALKRVPDAGFNTNKPIYLGVTAGELLHSEPVTDPIIANFLPSLTAADIDQILEMDPFYDPVTRTMRSGVSLDDAIRFRDAPPCTENLDISAEDTRTCTFRYSNGESTTSTQSASFDFNLGSKLVGGTSLSLTAGYTGTISTSSGSDAQAKIHVAGPYRGYVAFDSLFNEFALSANQ